MGPYHCWLTSPSTSFFLPFSPSLPQVQNLNALSDSNILLREERDRLQVQVKELEGTVEKLEGELHPLQEANKLLTGQKDALVAEKTALRCSVCLCVCMCVCVCVC